MNLDEWLTSFNCEYTLEEVIKNLAEMFARITYVDAFWPNPSNIGYKLFLDTYVKKLWDIYEKTREKGCTPKEVSKLFKSPTYIFRIFVRIPRTRDALDRKRRIKLSCFLLSMLKFLRSEEYYSGKVNRTLTQDEVKGITIRFPFRRMEEGQKKELNTIHFLLWSLTEANFWTRWATGCDFQGPYYLGDKIMLTRDFHTLTPIEIWNDLEDYPYKSIRTYTIYKGIRDVKIDCYGHLSFSGNLTSSSISYFGEVVKRNGERVEIWNEFERIASSTLKIIKERKDKINSLTQKEKVKKQAEIEWYILKPLLKRLNESIYPPEEVYRKIETREIEESPMLIKGEKRGYEERIAYYRKTLDPR